MDSKTQNVIAARVKAASIGARAVLLSNPKLAQADQLKLANAFDKTVKAAGARVDRIRDAISASLKQAPVSA